MKKKLTVDDTKLKGEYMHLLMEKGMYIKMVMKLYELGSKVHWEPELLRKIKPMLDDVREQIMTKGKPSQA